MSAEKQSTSHHFLKHARIIGAFTMLSRVLGLLREVIARHYLGTGLVASAFTVAFTIPNLFRKLLGEGALSQAFIPLYAQSVKRGTTESGDDPHNFASSSVKLLSMILIAITIIGELVLGGCYLYFANTRRSDHLLMLQFAAIMLPYVMLVCGGAFLSAILQVHKRFAAPAFAPVLLNLTHIFMLVIGAWFLGLHGRDHLSPAVEELQTKLAHLLSIGVIIAGFLQLLVLFPALRASGFVFKPSLPCWSVDTKKMLRMSIPVAIGAAVLQTSVMLDKGISYALMEGKVDDQIIETFTLFGNEYSYPMELGAPSRLDVAQLMYQFPLGIFAIAIATAIFPSMAAGAIDTQREEFKRITRQGIETTLWEGLPATVGLILVADPAVRLLFQHGQVTEHDADLIIQSTRYYAGGVWAYSLLQIINRAYYALHDTKTPLYASIINIIVNLIVELPLIWYMGEAGMAVGTLVSFSLQTVFMIALLSKRVGGLGLRTLISPICKMMLATLAMLAVCLVIQHLPIYPITPNRINWLIQLISITVIGAAVYLVLCKLMKVKPVLKPAKKTG